MENLEEPNENISIDKEKKSPVEKSSKNNKKKLTIEEPDAFCIFFIQGACINGDNCPMSHDILPPRKLELCRYYLKNSCTKGNRCNYMHNDFPCKFYHTDGLKCNRGDKCLFSHEPLDKRVVNHLLKLLELEEEEVVKEEEKTESIVEENEDEKSEIKEEETFSFYQENN